MRTAARILAPAQAIGQASGGDRPPQTRLKDFVTARELASEAGSQAFEITALQIKDIFFSKDLGKYCRSIPILYPWHVSSTSVERRVLSKACSALQHLKPQFGVGYIVAGARLIVEDLQSRQGGIIMADTEGVSASHRRN